MWADLPPDDVRAGMDASGMWRAGRTFWPFVSPVGALLAVVNLAAAWRRPAPYRRWWIAAGALMTAYALISYGYCVPQMLHFQASGATWSAERITVFVERITVFVDRWTGLDYGRMALGGAGWLCALRALSLSGTPHAVSPPSGPRQSRSGP